MRYIGLDLGTSFIKGAILDLDRMQVTGVRRVSAPQPLKLGNPLRMEYDPEAFVDLSREVISELLSEAPDCEAMVLSGQMGGLVLTLPGGKCSLNYISWQDRRILESHPSGHGTFYDAWLSRMTEEDWRLLGREIRPGTPFGFLFCLAEQQAAFPKGAIAATLPDFILARLCSISPVVHPTHAVGGINLETMDWHRALAARLGFGGIAWPELRDIRDPVGEFAVESRRLKCFPPVGDHPCTLAGVLLDFDELSLNISTGSQVSVRVRQFEPGDFQTTPFFDGEFLRRTSNLPAGRAITALVRLFSELAEAEHLNLSDPWGYIARAAEKVSPEGIEARVTFFPTPLGSSGSLSNLREENLTIGHVFRASFENMADNFHECAQRLCPNRAWQRLVFSGGLVQAFPILQKAIISRFNCASRQCDTSEDVMRGLLAIALVSSRRARSMAEAIQWLRDGC